MKKTITKLKVHQTAPDGFVPKVEVAACYLEINHQLLVLERAEGKLEEGKWGVPAGKLEKGESPEMAAKRELFEETGILISHMQCLDALYIRKPEIDYIYHPFKIHLEQMPEVCLSDEHQSYRWVHLNEIESLDLMNGAKEVLQYYQSVSHDFK